jgi:hypothetical protein
MAVSANRESRTYPQPIGGIRMLTALLTGLGTALSDILSTVGATLGGLL